MKLYTVLFLIIFTSLHAQENMCYIKIIEADFNLNGVQDKGFLSQEVGPQGTTIEIEVQINENESIHNIVSNKMDFPSQENSYDNFQLFNFSYSEGYLCVVYIFKSIYCYHFFNYTVKDFDLVYYSEFNSNLTPQTSHTLNLKDGIIHIRKSSEGEIIYENSRNYPVLEIPTLSNFSGFALKKIL